MPLHIATPLLVSTPVSAAFGHPVMLKMDALQPSGSFKMRGIGHACEVHAGRGAKRFVSSSGGNAGIAVAVSGRQLGIPVLVVVPETTGARARDILQSELAEVVVHGASWMEANAHAQSLLRASDAFIHPFDDALVWAGHATLIDEVAQAGVRPDAVVLSVGGGGLYAGVVQGMERHGWNDVPVVAVETEGADSFYQAVAAGEIVTLPAIRSIANSLGARAVCERALALSQRHPTVPVLVSDQDAVTACRRFLNDHRMLVEPACGAALAAVYGRLPQLGPFKNVLVIVCGGAGITVESLAQLAA
jgi:L-serine/L-threonine ammonia-lyase